MACQLASFAPWQGLCGVGAPGWKNYSKLGINTTRAASTLCKDHHKSGGQDDRKCPARTAYLFGAARRHLDLVR